MTWGVVTRPFSQGSWGLICKTLDRRKNRINRTNSKSPCKTHLNNG